MSFEHSGRRPKPTAIHKLNGNPSKKKLNENEPCPPAGEVVKPGELSSHASGVWDRLAPVCLQMGTLTVADVPAFATLCELEATRVLAAAEKNQEGFTAFLVTTVPDPDGEVHVKITEHPAIKLERNTAAALRPYFDYFGMTPVGRARISVPQPEKPVSKWAGIA